MHGIVRLVLMDEARKQSGQRGSHPAMTLAIAIRAEANELA